MFFCKVRRCNFSICDLLIYASVSYFDTRMRTNSPLYSLYNLNRGKILIAFCEIEMIVDILTCYHLGVYSGKMTYEDVRRDYFAHSKPLSSFEDKKNYLLDNHIIDADIVDELRKVQTIRNEIARNYFLNHDLNLGRKNIKKLGSVNNVIEARFNYAWLLLMQAYSAVQVDVIKWTYAIKLGLEAK